MRGRSPRRPLCRGVAQQPGGLDPARFFRTNVHRHPGAGRSGPSAASSVSTTSRTCEVYGDLALDSDETFSEESPYRPRTPYNASKAGRTTSFARYSETYNLPVTITNCCNNYGPYQFPEKVIPLFTSPRRRQTATALRIDRQPSRVAPCRRPLPRHRVRPSDGRDGETYNVGSGVERSIEEIADAVLAAAGRRVVTQDDRPRPPGSRPPLPARFHQTEDPARLAARDPFLRRPAGHGRLVRLQPDVVGTSPAAAPRSSRRVAPAPS